MADKSELIKAGGATAAVAAAGGITAVSIGGNGLAVGGSAVSIGAAPIVAVGAIVGLAGYGVYRLFGGGKKKEDK